MCEETEQGIKIREDRFRVCDQNQLSQNRGKKEKTYQIEKDQH